MRGDEVDQGAVFSYISAEKRVPADHPLRKVRQLVDAALEKLSKDFDRLYSDVGRPSIPPERLLRALLLQYFYGIRSERMLMEQLDYNLLFRWFVGLQMDDPVWVPTTSRRTAAACWRAISRSAFCRRRSRWPRNEA
jgi:transposase